MKITNAVQYAMPAIYSGALAFITLPLYTIHLGPSDYGVFALLISISSLVSFLPSALSGYLFPTYFNYVDERRRMELVSTIVIVGSLVAVAFSALLAGMWQPLQARFPVLKEVPAAFLFLALGAELLEMNWRVANNMLVMQQRANFFAFGNLLRPTVAAAAVLVALFAFDAGGIALVIGYFASGALSAALAVYVLARYVRPTLSKDFIVEIRNMSGAFLVRILLAKTEEILQRTLLTTYAGLHGLGLYSHGMRYATTVQTGTKAVHQAAIPMMLDECHQPSPKFPRTINLWHLVQISIGYFALVFCFFAEDLIAILTNGKFTDAALYASALMLTCLLWISGQREQALLRARGLNMRLIFAETLRVPAGIVLLVVLVPSYGVWGAVAAAVVSEAVLRAAIVFFAQRNERIGFADGPVLAFCALLGSVLVGVQHLDADTRLALGTMIALIGAAHVIVGTMRFRKFEAEIAPARR